MKHVGPEVSTVFMWLLAAGVGYCSVNHNQYTSSGPAYYWVVMVILGLSTLISLIRPYAMVSQDSKDKENARIIAVANVLVLILAFCAWGLLSFRLSIM